MQLQRRIGRCIQCEIGQTLLSYQLGSSNALTVQSKVIVGGDCGVAEQRDRVVERLAQLVEEQVRVVLQVIEAGHEQHVVASVRHDGEELLGRAQVDADRVDLNPITLSLLRLVQNEWWIVTMT